MPPVDHECNLVEVVTQLLERVEKLERENAQLKKAHIGPKTERSRMPRPISAPVPPETQAATRRANAESKRTAQSLRVEHKVPAEQRTCPSCGNAQLKPVGKGRTTSVWEFVPARFVRNDHVQEVLKCPCGDYVVTAPGAPKVIEGGQYGASVLAHLVAAKCGNHLPLYRLEKDFRRLGFPIARSTMNDLLHRASAITRPIWTRILEEIRARPVVQADETRMRMQRDESGKPKNGFVWTFVSADDSGSDVALVFAGSRSGETPREILDGTAGYLMVDAYSGYNRIEEVSRRRRAACHAHLRRYFHESLPTGAVAQEAIDIILELYRIEHEAKERNLGTQDLLALRRTKAPPIRARLRAWMERQQALHPPRSPLGTAIKYGLNRWDDLGRFLEDGRIPLDNNASERALRPIALGRKNYLFVGDVEAGKSIAGLYTLIATCEARGINPFAYLVDVIGRVQDHPRSRIEELLPRNWAA
ncbi:MAG: IS66 family transposase [Myxococcota bacterium]